MKNFISIFILLAALVGATYRASQPIVKEVHVLTIPAEEVITVAQETPEEIHEENYYDSLEYMAACVEAEAGTQDLFGKRLVVDVILNRVDSDRFPNDIVSVISQDGQFSVYGSGAMFRIVPSEETYEAIRRELEDGRINYEIMFFSAHNYNSCCKPAFRHQDHYFGYLKER